jgi:hypothetical protein
MCSGGSSVSTGERQGFYSRQWKECFLYSTVLKPTLGPTQWLQWSLSSGIKLLKREAVHSPPSSAEVKNDGTIPPSPAVHSGRAV